MKEARSKWTTLYNLELWFDDGTAGSIKTGLLVDHKVIDLEGCLISEVDFRSDEV
jgi:hypothetical protein